METLKNIVTRLGPTGGPILIGFILIIYIGLGFLWWQQGSKQRQYEEQIAQLSTILDKPLPRIEELQARCDEYNYSLALWSDSDAIAMRDAIAMLVSIAEQSGIDISDDGGKFRVPSAIFNQTSVGGGTYQIISFRNIHVQGDYDDVMAFISILDSGEIPETMVLNDDEKKKLKITVLKRANISQTTASISAEERDRRAEFRDVISAVERMMLDNYIVALPNPMSFAGSIATNLMGDNPATGETIEGFPDIITTAAEKGYTGTGTPRNGYVLNRHDKISEGDSTRYETVSYLNTLTTTYYYTCEADGTVRQWDGPTVATAREYTNSEASIIEIKANVDVDIYTTKSR